MKRNYTNIRIFIDNKLYIFSKYSSIYSIKEETNNLHNNLLYQGKILKNKKSLEEYNIKDNSILEYSISQKGGASSGSVLLYIILFILYILFLWSGFPTLISKILSISLKKSINYIVSKVFGKSKRSIIIKNIIMFFVWFFIYFSLIYFIKYTIFYMAFAIYYIFQEEDFCEAGKKAEDISNKVTKWYIIIYICLNLVNYFIDGMIKILEYTEPEIVKGSAIVALDGFERGWNKIKYWPVYILPLIGKYFNFLHINTPNKIHGLYSFLDKVNQKTCSDDIEKNLQIMKDLYESQIYTLKGGSIKNKIKKLYKYKDPKEQIQSRYSYFTTMAYVGALIQFIRNKYQYESDEVVEQEIQKVLQKYPPMKKYREGYFISINRNISVVISQMACQVIQVISEIYNDILQMGEKQQVINMVESAQISGFISSIVFIVYIFINL